MQAQPKTIRDILHTGDQYIIPLFQRYYSWEKSHWERLRLDVWNLFENGAKPVHFLGPLVCHLPFKMPGSTASFQLIDGQQRLTTLTIMLAAIRDVARARGLDDLADEITEDYLLFKRKQGSERYKVLPRLGDREVLTAMVEGHDLAQFAESQVHAAWKYFQRHVQHLSRKETEKQLRKLLNVLTTRLNLVVVVIDGENPYEIFDSLNSTGLPLAQSDLIRNFVFMDIPVVKQQEFDDRHWKPLEAMFAATETEKAVVMTPFYRDYLMRNGRYTREDAIFVDFKESHEEAVKEPEALTAELKRCARLDLMLRRPGAVKDQHLRQLLRQVAGMEITTAFPLLLNLLERHDRGQLSKVDLCGCLRDLVSFVLRRSICGESTRAYGRWFVEAITLIRDNPRADLQTYWLSRRWPDDATMRERLPEFDLYRRESLKARVILERIEQSFNHHEKVDLAPLTIEHVMPQTITNNKNGKAWKDMLGPDWEVTYSTWLHTLGNLTLTGYNTELSNAPFDIKQVELANSHLDLNVYFEKLHRWDAESIRLRGRDLTEKVLELWPRPSSDIGYSASSEAQPEPTGLSSAAKSRLDYWRHLDARLEERGFAPDMINPTPDSALSIAVGTTGEAEFVLSFNQPRGQIHVSLALSGNAGGRIGQALFKDKETIEHDVGCPLDWKIGKSGGEIWATDEGIPIRDQNDWPVQHDWFGDRLEDFQRVLQPRVEALEQEVLLDPKIKRELEKRQLLTEYWQSCAATLDGAKLMIRPSDCQRGRTYCPLAILDDGVQLGAECYPHDKVLTVYLGVTRTADSNQRQIFKQLVETKIAELSSTIGQEVEGSDDYLWVYLDADPGSKEDWPRQHKWIKETTERFREEFRSRLAIP